MKASSIALRLFSLPGFALLFNPCPQGERIFICLDPMGPMPLEAVDQLQAQQEAEDFFIAGFISYEYAHRIENFPGVLSDRYQLPECMLFQYSKVVELSSESCVIRRFRASSAPLWRASDLEISSLIDSIRQKNFVPAPSAALYATALELGERYSNFSKAAYEKSVQFIREEIERGEVYQVNLSQQIAIPGAFDAWQIFNNLIAVEKGAYSAFFSVGDSEAPKHIVSNSPELFFERSGTTISACPVKGTAPRLADPDKDRKSMEVLFSDEKERAELAMIVDLFRNDLGKIARPGTVRVEEFPRLFSLNKVHHLCAPITASIAGLVSFRDIMHALFPSGSVTGAPKISAMKYIADLERTARGVYCGSIGWCSADKSVWNVAIRTGVVSQTSCIFQAGGGVTFDSDPAREYYETIDKALSFVQAISGANSTTRDTFKASL